MAALIGTLNRFLWRVRYRDDPAMLLPCQQWKLSRGTSDDGIPYLRTGLSLSQRGICYSGTSLWVISCRDAQWLARQLRPQHRTRRGTVGAAVQGQLQTHAAQRVGDERPAKQPVWEPSTLLTSGRWARCLRS
jgi:hypothetical protein